jgi:hypothetical protein
VLMCEEANNPDYVEHGEEATCARKSLDHCIGRVPDVRLHALRAINRESYGFGRPDYLLDIQQILIRNLSLHAIK